MSLMRIVDVVVQPLATAVVLLVAVATIADGAAGPDRTLTASKAFPPVSAVHVFVRGREYLMSTGQEQLIRLVQLCEQDLSDANDEMQLIVDKARIDRIKHDEIAIELTYERSFEACVPALNHQYQIDRLLLPLSGRWVVGPEGQPMTSVFMGEGESYFGPPLVTLGRDTGDILDCVKRLGIQIP